MIQQQQQLRHQRLLVSSLLQVQQPQQFWCRHSNNNSQKHLTLLLQQQYQKQQQQQQYYHQYNYYSSYSSSTTTIKSSLPVVETSFEGSSSCSNIVSNDINNDNNNDNLNNKECTEITENEQLRIAIIGNGCSGLCTALYLAELVEKGYITNPIDVYYHENDDDSINPKNYNNTKTVGVGIWSTALDKFKNSSRLSHHYFYNQLTNVYGTYSTQVGYRIPNGTWILQSTLSNTDTNTNTNTNTSNTTTTQPPSLIFIRECDLLQLFKKTINMYESKYIKFHSSKYPIEQLYNNTDNNNNNDSSTDQSSSLSKNYSTSLVYSNGTKTNTKYHLIIAADGTYSKLRQKYNTSDGTSRSSIFGNSNSNNDNNNGTIIPTSNSNEKNSNYNFTDTNATNNSAETSSSLSFNINDSNIIQERGYTIFRGNSPISNQQMLAYSNTNTNTNTTTTSSDNNTILSFQTWGENNHMRFATVPIIINTIEHQVWFITISNTIIDNELHNFTSDNNNNNTTNNNTIRDWLITKFYNWHEPIQLLISSTPINEIYIDRAIAHTTIASPVVFNFNNNNNNNNKLTQNQNNNNNTNNNSSSNSPTTDITTTTTTTTSTGPPTTTTTGPILLFHGDACMTIDPILAQGITCAMEGSYSIKQTIENAIFAGSILPSSSSSSSSSSLGQQHSNTKRLQYDPYILQQLLYQRHLKTIDRLQCVIHVSDLVQFFSQPATTTTGTSANTSTHTTGTSTISISTRNIIGWINISILRPTLINLVPNFIKQPIFDIVLQYSLGLGYFNKKKKSK